MKKWMLAYSCLFFVICLLPFVGMAVDNNDENRENRTLQEFPSLVGEEGLNVSYLQELGDYFQDHFGFRSGLVTANARVTADLFGVSAAQEVIAGTDGWLYYKDSLDDYLGLNQLSDRALFNIAHTLAMMQNYVEKAGGWFLFTVAPNKNSLYGEHMPYYASLKTNGERNLTRLPEFLQAEGVHYADLYGMFEEKDEVLYHKRDSHWNNKGAALASAFLLEQFGEGTIDWEQEPCEVRCDYEGDLDVMLFPQDVTPEDEIYYQRGDVFAYVGEVESNFDPMIQTVNPSGKGSLVMYRDSFGNALLPFLANHFENAYFSRGVPYQMSDLETHQADTLIVERAERFLPEMAENPPVMQGPLSFAGEVQEAALDGAEILTTEKIGSYSKITGYIAPGYVEDNSRIFIRFGENVYEAFPATVNVDGDTCDAGFVLYMDDAKMEGQESQMEILVGTGNSFRKVFEE